MVRGRAGWGEFSPFLEYDARVAAPWWRAALEAADEGWPAPVRDRVPVNVTVPAVDPEQAHAIVPRGGCRTAKVKVAEPGQTLADDEARLEAVRDALGPGGLVRVDANGGWDLDTAVRLDRRARPRRRRPGVRRAALRTVEELAAVRRRVEVPIAADESIRRAEDPYRVRDLEAADIAVLKVQPLGGVRACLRIAEDIGLPVVVSSALETSVGIAAGVALAAALPELPHACGLATVQLLTDDLAVEPLLPQDGPLPVVRPEVDPAKLAALAAPADRVAHWRGAPRRDQAGCWLVTDHHPRIAARNAATAMAEVVVDELLRGGVRHLVLSPGSRSAALAFAAYDAAAAGRLTLHTRIDERTAAFLALGLAKSSRRPVAVVTTSGTAVANLHPAVLEADHAGIPLSW